MQILLISGNLLETEGLFFLVGYPGYPTFVPTRRYMGCLTKFVLVECFPCAILKL